MSLFTKLAGLKLPNALRKSGIFPFFRELNSLQATHAECARRSLIMMGSNNYLGLTHHPEVMQASIDAIREWGTGCTGSRFLNGNLSMHVDLERQLSSFFGYEDSLIFATGYMTNQGAISSLVGENDYIFSDRDNHASIIEGCTFSEGNVIVYNHCDMADLEEKLRAVPHAAGKLIVTDGVFSMSGALAPYDRIHELSRRYNAYTYVDEAHGIGMIGPNGRGAAAHYGCKPDFLMGTFSKSLASQGGFICGSSAAIDWIRLKARTMMFSASLAPACVAAAHRALQILIASPHLVTDLQMKADYLRAKLKNLGLTVLDARTGIISVVVGDDTDSLALSKKFELDGVFVTPVLYPAVPRGKALIRCSVMATHSLADLDYATEIFAKHASSIRSKPRAGALHEMLDQNLTTEQVHDLLEA